MVWTPPATWVAGVGGMTATLMNARVRDNFKAIGDPWTAYTPTTSWTLGNGVRSAKWMQAGKITFWEFTWTLGSTDTYAGVLALTLPFTPAKNFEYHPFGEIGVKDISAAGNASRRFLTATWQASTTSMIFINPVDGAPFTNATPFTLATGDIISGQGFYEAA